MVSPRSYGKLMDALGDAQKPARIKFRERGWNHRHHTHGYCDTGNPKMRRRYFDEVCNEPSCPKVDPLWEFDSEVGDQQATSCSAMSQGGESQRKRKPWVDAFWMDCSTDNPLLNPLLRHYFDRRGIEASYRTRPEVAKHAPVLPSKSPREPYPQHSKESKALIKNEPNIHWGNRCLMYGCKYKLDKKAQTMSGEIPWVEDHNVDECVDNVGLHPYLRHYFDRDGLPSSFKNRGRNYGRPLPDHPFRGTMRVPRKIRETFSRTMSSVSLPAGSGPILLGGESAPWGRGAGEILAPSDPKPPGHNQLEAPGGATAIWDDHWWWDGPGRRKPYSHGPAASAPLLSETISYPALLKRPTAQLVDV